MIAYGMLYAIAVGLPILLAAAIVSAVVRRQGRAERGLWLAALVLSLTLPLVALRSPAAEKPAVPVPVAGTGLIGLPAVVAVPAVPVVSVPMARSALDLDRVLLGLWLFASMVLGLRWAVATIRLTGLTRFLPTDTLDGVRVSVTTDLGPAVSGVVRPRIIVPSWLVSMPPHQRALVLLHEEEHVRARDPLLVAAARIARVLAPWNPVVWLLSSRLGRAVELDCDRRVLRRHPDVEAYGTTLLTVSSRAPGGLATAAAFARSEAPLRTRILAMTTPPSTVPVVGILTASVLGVLLLVGVFEVPVPAIRVQVDVEPTGLPAVGQDGVQDAARTGTLTGIVRDESSNQPLQHVQISVPGTGLGGLTDEEGRIDLSRVPAGEHRVVAELIGYREVAQTVTVGEGATAALDFQLSETAIQLGGVVVSERRGEGASGAVVQVSLKPDAPDPGPPLPRSVTGQPIFTPFSRAPSVVNEEEVQRALAAAYPPELRADGIEGTVSVYFFVDPDGIVQYVRIQESSGHQALDDAALAVAGVFRFSPALNRDQPRPVWVSFPMAFLTVPG